MDCLTPQSLNEYIIEPASQTSKSHLAVTRHLAICEKCRGLLMQLLTYLDLDPQEFAAEQMCRLTEEDSGALIRELAETNRYPLAAAAKQPPKGLQSWISDDHNLLLNLEAIHPSKLQLSLIISQELQTNCGILAEYRSQTCVSVKPDGVPVRLHDDVPILLAKRPTVELYYLLVVEKGAESGTLDIGSGHEPVHYEWKEKLVWSPPLPSDLDYAIADSNGVWFLGKRCHERAQIRGDFHFIAVHRKTDRICLRAAS